MLFNCSQKKSQPFDPLLPSQICFNRGFPSDFEALPVVVDIISLLSTLSIPSALPVLPAPLVSPFSVASMLYQLFSQFLRHISLSYFLRSLSLLQCLSHSLISTPHPLFRLFRFCFSCFAGLVASYPASLVHEAYQVHVVYYKAGLRDAGAD